MSAFDNIRQALSDAQTTLDAADRTARQMAEMLCGRLRHVDNWTLRKLKRELTAYDSHKRVWKEPR